MPPISTRNARVTVTNQVTSQSANILATRWVVEVKADEIDTTTFESGGYAEFLPSYVQADISVDGFYESGGSPFAYDAGVDLCCAGSYVALDLYSHRTGAAGTDGFFFPAAYILTASGATAVRDAARVSFTAKNVGSFTYPGGVTFAGVDEV
jgi:hypothetical protein